MLYCRDASSLQRSLLMSRQVKRSCLTSSSRRALAASEKRRGQVRADELLQIGRLRERSKAMTATVAQGVPRRSCDSWLLSEARLCEKARREDTTCKGQIGEASPHGELSVKEAVR
jgi:hypothetical protein